MTSTLVELSYHLQPIYS